MQAIAFASVRSDAGIETAVHYPRPLHRQPLLDRGEELPVSESLCEKILALPVHPKLSKADIDRVVEAITRAVG